MGRNSPRPRRRLNFELAIDCIKRTKASGNRAKIVVFDCLYFALWFILALRADELHFVTRAKSNRIFIINGEKMKAKQILASVKSYKRYKRTSTTYYHLCGELPGFGPVKLVAVQFLQDGDKEVKEALLVTDYLGLSGAQVVGTYLKRGQIETFFKEAKSNFMLEYYHLLRLHGISNYISFCFFCYWVAQEIRKVSGLHLTTSQMQVYFRLGLIQYLVEQKVANIYERIPQKPYFHWIFLVIMLVNSLLVLNYVKL